MWISNATFNQVDSRLQVSKYISKKWKAELEKPKYLNANDKPWKNILKKLDKATYTIH